MRVLAAECQMVTDRMEMKCRVKSRNSIPDGNDSDGEKPEGAPAGSMPGGETSDGNAQDELVTSGMGVEVGTPDSGTTQSADSRRFLKLQQL